ncbi:PilN domain-containing protein [Nitrospirillum iridis]|uniref:Fimbrial assembly protein n=1 Tax=Nitrospirillum iridis TaxID=765888 RepID=A0A7X0B2U5_9PROT|nr:PilN domain-containing protein [Nitrospirillum iridis]MBB6253386.1 hypothetical protein [Nitrospirillum iridis]
MKRARLLALLASTVDGVADGFAWALPTRFSRYLGLLPRVVRLPPGGEGAVGSVGRGPARLVLDAQDVYTIDLPLPRGVSVDPWAQARMQAHRFMPLKPALLAWDLVTLREAGQRFARVSMVRRAVLDAALRSNTGVIEVTTDGVRPQPQFLRLEPRRLRLRALRILILLAVPVLTVPVPLLLATWILDQQTRHMEQKLKALSEDVKAVRMLRERAEVLGNVLDHSGGLLVQPSRGRLLDEVARVLPDDAWLQELSMSADGLVLQGRSANAEDVLARFRDEPLFTDVHLSTPAGVDGAGAFSLTFSIARTGGLDGAPEARGSGTPSDTSPVKGMR